MLVNDFANVVILKTNRFGGVIETRFNRTIHSGIGHHKFVDGRHCFVHTYNNILTLNTQLYNLV